MRQEALAKEEARGASFWTRTFNDGARTRFRALFDGMPDSVAERVGRMLKLELGLDNDIANSWELDGFLEAECPDELMPSAIEACLIAHRTALPDGDAGVLQAQANNILAEERISFELINGQMVEFESKELHQEVVAPVLRLLSGRPGWDKVETAYEHALGEISAGQSADAITDAGTALQEALTQLGCQGNALGPLIQSAKKKNLLASHDPKLAEGIEKIAHWVSSDRSAMGDSHKAGTSVTRDDAWLSVHVVGALILRLASGTGRG